MPWKTDWTVWNARSKKKATELEQQLQQAGLPQSLSALDQVVFSYAQRYQRGVESYVNHTYRRPESRAQPRWKGGSAQLLDFGQGQENGPIVLAIPSFINPSSILDLTPERSLLQHLKQAGMRCFLLDWGQSATAPDLDSLMAQRIDRAVVELSQEFQRPIILLGYCMGGTISVAAALSHGDKIGGLALLATPWDFQQTVWHHSGVQRPFKSKGAGEISLSALDQTFFALDPMGIVQKYCHFADMSPDAVTTQRFVAVEDWLNGGQGVSAALATSTIHAWYGAANPAAGLWRFRGRKIHARDVSCPALVMTAARDRLVLPASAQAFEQQAPDSQEIIGQSGHIGLLVGQRAVEQSYQPIAQWVAKISS